MRAGMVALCVGAVTFLLWVLVALMREWLTFSPRTEMFYLSKFSPSRPRGELIVLNSEDINGKFPTGTDERMAI